MSFPIMMFFTCYIFKSYSHFKSYVQLTFNTTHYTIKEEISPNLLGKYSFILLLACIPGPSKSHIALINCFKISPYMSNEGQRLHDKVVLYIFFSNTTLETLSEMKKKYWY